MTKLVPKHLMSAVKGEIACHAWSVTYCEGRAYGQSKPNIFILNHSTYASCTAVDNNFESVVTRLQPLWGERVGLGRVWKRGACEANGSALEILFSCRLFHLGQLCVLMQWSILSALSEFKSIGRSPNKLLVMIRGRYKFCFLGSLIFKPVSDPNPGSFHASLKCR